MGIYFEGTFKMLQFLAAPVDSKLALEGLMMLCCGKVCGNGNYDRHGLGYTITSKVPKNKSFKTLPEIYFRPPQNNLWHLCLLKIYPTASSGSVNKMDELCEVKLFLGFFDGNASYPYFLLFSFYIWHITFYTRSPTNLKRWRLTTEAMCTLYCTYFRSLQVITSSRKIYIHIKEAVPIYFC